MALITIKRAGRLIKITPGCPELLAGPLSYRKRIQLSGDAKDVQYENTQLFRLEQGSLLVPAGLTARVCRLLRQAGHEPYFVDYRAQLLPEPCYENLGVLRSGQDEIIAALVGSDGGIIQAPTGTGKSWVIKQLARLYPTVRIIVCSYSRDIVKQIHAEMLELFPPAQVGLVGAGRSESDRRIVCAIDKSLDKCDLRACRIFVYDEAHRAAAPQTAQVISEIDNARCFAFSASPFGRGDKADLETEAMFGPPLCVVEYQDAQKRGLVVPIQVVVKSTLTVAQYVSAGKDTTVMERNAVWRNSERNRVIAAAVREAERLYGPDPQILITVAKLEHGVHLGALLPDYTLVYANMDPVKRMRWERDKLIPAGVHPLASHVRDQYREAFRAGTLRKAIATGVWGTGVDFPGLNVIVRADAQGGSIVNTQLPGRVTRVSEGKEVGIVIDFDDVFCATLQERALQRFRQYKKKGWQIALPAVPAYFR